MRLLEVTISNFRGFGSSGHTINLDADLVLVFGPNGFGKTSLSEAIEWLFYGSTKRRLQGEQYSKAEYNGTFANVHGGTPIEVEAKVQLGTKIATIARRITNGESTETFIDGVATPFSSIGIQALESVYPVIAQHGLQTFIHTKPKERRDALCAALGLDDLTSFKRALESARASFQRTPPQIVVSARREISTNATALAKLDADLGRRWQQNPPTVDADKDIAALLKAAATLVETPFATEQEALVKLREKRIAASRSVFDVGKVSLRDEIELVLAELPKDCFDAKTSFGAMQVAAMGFLAATASAYSKELLAFWESGLKLSLDGDSCPMCEAPTLTNERRAALRLRLERSADWSSKRKALVESTEAATRVLARVIDRHELLCLEGLAEEERALLGRLLPDSVDLKSFLQALSDYQGALIAQKSELQTIGAFLAGSVKRLEEPEDAPTVVQEMSEVDDALERYEKAILQAVATYQAAWGVFEPILAQKIASDGLVASIDAVGKSLKLGPQLKLLARFENILISTQKLVRDTEELVKTKQAALLKTRGAEVKDFYKLLNGSFDVGFDEMEPGTDSMKIHATSFGVQMPAAANLSECQLNCLGLSVWLMRATSPSSPFGFLILDDPVQSMDDDHAEAFMAKVVPQLLDSNKKQLIVLSHVKTITQRLRQLNLQRDHRLFHLESYDRAGPAIVEQSEIHRRLAEIKGAAKGNESNREMAVDRLRVLIEHVIREIHLKVMGVAAPAQFDRATPDQLLQLFRTITGTTQQEYAGLKDSVGFCDPAHHSEVGYSVPQQPKIMPHIDRVEQLSKKYGVLR